MGPTFAISPAMLRSSNNARLMVGACRRRTASSARKWSSSRGARRRDYRRIPAVNSFSKFLLLTPKGRSEAEIGVDAAFQVREHSYLWSSVDPTLPYPLPCYGPLTGGDRRGSAFQKPQSVAADQVREHSSAVEPLLVGPHVAISRAMLRPSNPAWRRISSLCCLKTR